MDEVVLCRYGELALKGGNRGWFERALLRNLQRALPAGARADWRGGRILVQGADAATVMAHLQHVFGLVAFHPALSVPAELQAIEAAAVLQAQRAPEAASFKVEARRADKRFPLTSPQLNASVGAAVLRACPRLRVDVHHPELVIGVEVRPDAAYVFGPVTSGAGGLPVGTSGRALLLLSGGIDSPVAGYLACKRGLDLCAAYFHAFPFTGEPAKQKVVDLARLLARHTGRLHLWVVHFTDIQLAIRDRCPDEFGTIVARRMMVRLAERLALRERAGALVTGESLGQVASQTLEGLTAIGEVAELPILRPLITSDKVEVVALARRISTYPISIRPFEDCCSVFVPSHPKTRPTRAASRAAEARLDVPALVEEALSRSERLTLEPAMV